jgi:hypothetical protein
MICDCYLYLTVRAEVCARASKRRWKASSPRKEINAPSYLETVLSGRSLVWKDISLPTNKAER